MDSAGVLATASIQGEVQHGKPIVWFGREKQIDRPWPVQPQSVAPTAAREHPTIPVRNQLQNGIGFFILPNVRG